jgi:hypothetical protein
VAGLKTKLFNELPLKMLPRNVVPVILAGSVGRMLNKKKITTTTPK